MSKTVLEMATDTLDALAESGRAYESLKAAEGMLERARAAAGWAQTPRAVRDALAAHVAGLQAAWEQKSAAAASLGDQLRAAREASGR